MKSQGRDDLGAFFEPRGVAVIGSLKERWSGGYGVIKNLLRFGFAGNIYPINPSYSEILGVTAYPTVTQVTEAIDLAIVVIPPPAVPAVIGRCAQKGVKAAIIISDGFAEASKDGAKLQKQVVDIAHRTGIRVIGPNTIGIANSANGLVINPYPIDSDRIWRGAIAYGSQTGMLGPQGLQRYASPMSKICDLGNKCDVNEIDFLNYLANDPETKVIALHLEDVRDGQQFMDTVRKVAAQKPVLVLKPGRSEAGAKAATSHTGSLAGNDQVYDSAFKQAGIIRLNTLQEFFEMPKIFAYQPLPAGNRIAIVTMSGGGGTMAVDTAVQSGLTIAQLSDTTVAKLARLAPRLAARNPVDCGPVMPVVDDFLPIHQAIIAAVLSDTNVDCAAIFLFAGARFPTPAIVNMFDRLRQQASKPMSIWIGGAKLSLIEELSYQLETLGLPTYFSLEAAIKALGIAADYAKIKSRLNRETDIYQRSNFLT